jgi:putative ABC transport system permease protein
MGAVDINNWTMLWALALIIPVLLMGMYFRIGFTKDLLISTARMVIQLGLVALYLEYLFVLNNTALNIAYSIIMATVAGFSIIKSSKVNLKIFWKSVLISILVPYILVLVYFNAVIIQLDNIFDAQYVIVVGGMILGNILGVNIFILSNFTQQAQLQNNTYLSMKGMGASKFEALRPIIVESIKTSYMPTIAKMATIGIVSLPGMMTGQILGGSSPTVAIKYQIAIMLAILCSGFLSICLQIILGMRVAYNEYDILKLNISKAKKK